MNTNIGIPYRVCNFCGSTGLYHLITSLSNRKQNDVKDIIVSSFKSHGSDKIPYMVVRVLSLMKFDIQYGERREHLKFVGLK